MVFLLHGGMGASLCHCHVQKSGRPTFHQVHGYNVISASHPKICSYVSYRGKVNHYTPQCESINLATLEGKIPALDIKTSRPFSPIDMPHPCITSCTHMLLYY